MQDKRILEICTVPFGENGIVRFLMRIFSAMDHRGLRIDFACFTDPEPEAAQWLRDMGFGFHVLPPRNSDPAGYFLALRRLIRAERYDVVHVHSNSGTMAVELWAAKLGGAKVRIAHSHNTRCLHVALNRLLRPAMRAGFTDAMACSDSAAEWLFPGVPCTVLKNCVDTDASAFSPDDRARLRSEMGLDGCFVVGCVARFDPAKNHEFLLRVFRRLLETRLDSVLMLVGEGNGESAVRQQASDLGIEKSLIFTGVRKDVPALLSAMDAGVLPSLYEGLPAAALEYQCSGLPSLLSDAMCADSAPTPLARLLPLDENAWVDALANIPPSDRASRSAAARIRVEESGCGLRGQANALRAFYLSR